MYIFIILCKIILPIIPSESLWKGSSLCVILFSSKANKEKTNETGKDDKSKIYKMGLSTDRDFITFNFIHHRKMNDLFRRQIKGQTQKFFNSQINEAGDNKLALTKANIFSPELSGAENNFSGETYIKELSK